MTTKEKLHRLIDELPERELQEAERLIERLHQRATDPLLRALAGARDDDELETEDERTAVEEARAEIVRGEWSNWEDARARLLADDES